MLHLLSLTPLSVLYFYFQSLQLFLYRVKILSACTGRVHCGRVHRQSSGAASLQFQHPSLGCLVGVGASGLVLGLDLVDSVNLYLHRFAAIYTHTHLT